MKKEAASPRGRAEPGCFQAGNTLGIVPLFHSRIETECAADVCGRHIRLSEHFIRVVFILHERNTDEPAFRITVQLINGTVRPGIKPEPYAGQQLLCRDGEVFLFWKAIRRGKRLMMGMDSDLAVACEMQQCTKLSVFRLGVFFKPGHVFGEMKTLSMQGKAEAGLCR